MNINFFVPTRIIFGKDCVKDNAAELAKLGKTAFIVTGGMSAKKSGALGDITRALASNAQGYTVFDAITPNPDKALIKEGIKQMREAGADFVIAIGGGSPIDAGKAIAYKDGDGVLPIAAIPTTAGTGTEVTPYAILTDHEKQTKTSINSPEIFPRVALLDPAYTKTLGDATTINTAIDALSHAVEGMLSNKANAITDMLAREAIRLIAARLQALINPGELTYDDREALLYASTLAGAVIASAGTTGMHSMGYCLTYFHNIDHGRANGLLMAEFLRFVEKGRPDMTNRVLDAAGYPDISALKSALAKLLGQRERIDNAEFEGFSAIAIKAWNIVNCAVVPNERDLTDIYNASFSE